MEGGIESGVCANAWDAIKVMDFRNVVFVNPYLTDKASGQMNAIYAKHFEFGNTPARATIRVASLPGGNTIEFTGVAVADLSKRLAVRPKNMLLRPWRMTVSSSCGLFFRLTSDGVCGGEPCRSAPWHATQLRS